MVAKVTCSVCGEVREIRRIGNDNSKLFWCSSCSKMVKPKMGKK